MCINWSFFFNVFFLKFGYWNNLWFWLYDGYFMLDVLGGDGCLDLVFVLNEVFLGVLFLDLFLCLLELLFLLLFVIFLKMGWVVILIFFFMNVVMFLIVMLWFCCWMILFIILSYFCFILWGNFLMIFFKVLGFLSLFR